MLELVAFQPWAEMNRPKAMGLAGPTRTTYRPILSKHPRAGMTSRSCGYPGAGAVFVVRERVGYLALCGTAVETGIVMVVHLEEALEKKRKELGDRFARLREREMKSVGREDE